MLLSALAGSTVDGDGFGDGLSYCNELAREFIAGHHTHL
jgi:hypothetical protein